MSTNTANLTNYQPTTPKRTMNDYADIIKCQRPCAKHPMSTTNRAAQFAPYAALVGHKDIIAFDEAEANTKIDIDHDIIIEYDE